MTQHKRGRDKHKIFISISNKISELVKYWPLFLRKYFLNIFRNTKGLKGIALRYIFLKSIAIKCGSNVSIHPGVYIITPERLNIGSNVSIHPMCYVDSAGYIEIGNDVSIAHGTTILSSTHITKSKNIPIKDQGIELKKTIIKNNVWIGAKATIISSVVLEEGSIIGAGAVVTKSFPQNTIIAGIPAKVIKSR